MIQLFMEYGTQVLSPAYLLLYLRKYNNGKNGVNARSKKELAMLFSCDQKQMGLD